MKNLSGIYHSVYRSFFVYFFASARFLFRETRGKVVLFWYRKQSNIHVFAGPFPQKFGKYDGAVTTAA